MGETVTRLSNEAKVFAEKNIGILFAFVKRYHLPEDYFGALAVAYVRFVGKYLAEKEKYAHSFSTLVWQRLRSELSHIVRKEKDSRRAVFAEEEFGSMGEEDCYFELAAMNDVRRLLTPKQAQILLLRIEGYTNAQIASMVNVSESAIEKRFERIRQSFQKVM